MSNYERFNIKNSYSTLDKTTSYKCNINNNILCPHLYRTEYDKNQFQKFSENNLLNKNQVDNKDNKQQPK